ncbi:uncharacterized protein zfhx2 [Clarias gariepinus]
MQEELGETMGGDNDGGSMWLCPLCQQGQKDRDGLALHLAEKHSVLPACLDKLLDIATPKHLSNDEDRERAGQNDLNGTSQQQCSENSPLIESQNETIPSVTDQDGSSQEKVVCDELGEVGKENDGSNIESNQDNVTQSESSEASGNEDKSSDKSNTAADDVNHPFKCHACLEFFPTRSALSVHYNSATHIQRMRTGAGNDSDSPAPVLARPYVSNKPYQCAVCRVSYNHAITLESHLKSVLHQSRSRSAGNAASNSTTNAGNGNVAANVTATTVANTTQLAYVTTSNCVTQASLTASQAMTKDEEQVKPQPTPSLLSSPVASAQAVSAFLTLLTSSPNSVQHSILPSLFAAGTGAAPSTATTQLITQPQMLMPLILNGLQAQSPTSEAPKQLLQQTVPVLGLSTAQQALLTQGLSGLQSQWAPFRLSNAAQMPPEESENSIDEGAGAEVKNEEPQQESCDQQVPQTSEEAWTTDDGAGKSSSNTVDIKQERNGFKYDKSVEDDIGCTDEKQEKDDIDMESTTEEGDLGENAKRSSDANTGSPGQVVQCSCPSPCLNESCQSTTHNNKSTGNSLELQQSPAKCNPSNTNLALMSSQPKSAKAHAILTSGPPMLSEFQSQVLWAFIESQNEADSAIPPKEDCEALGREVGLTGDEVRRWLVDACRAKERHNAEEMDHDEMEGSIEDEEGALMIDESEYGQSPSASSSHAIDLSNSSDIRKEMVYSQNQGDLCLTSDSENEEFYTSVIVTDEESQSSSMKDEPGSPIKQLSQLDTSGERSSGGGKVLRSTTVFLSDAEDDDEDQGAKNKKRKREIDKEESECKKERHDADLDLQLEAQADPPTPLSVTVDHSGLPAGILHSLPLSLSLAPFSTQLFSPYVLSVPSSVVGVGISEADRAKVATYSSPPAITCTQSPFSDQLHGAAISSLAQSAQFISNGSECESALDLSIGKHQSSTNSTSVSANKVSIQKTALLDGLGLRPTVGVPADGSLIVVQVKPDTAITIPNSNTTIGNHSSMAKTSTVFMRAAEKVNASLKESEQEKARDQKRTSARRFRDMRRSRTIIQADQLDVLYGCYFKDPNPGKHEFEQISEWVHLPKKVVQIWFQNMRARERKGEVRFISDGTLAAVGKPLIKFTWPLTKPIFSSTPKSNSSPTTPGWVPPKPQTGSETQKTEKVMEVKEPLKIPIQGLSRPKEMGSTTTVGSTSALKTKAEAPNAFTMVKIAPKAVPPLVPMPISGSAIAPNSQKIKLEGQSEADRTEEKDGKDQEKHIPGTTNRMVPKLSTTPINKSSTVTTQKHNGINYWSQKGPIKINTLSREQLGLSTTRTIMTSASVGTPSMTITSPPSTQNQKEANYIQQHSTPRRPRTHLNCLQLSILQSCYETCAHPNALECEAVGTELGLPLKVVQIWFQNTRAKEKRWRLQQEKLSPNSSDPSKKLDISSGTYLQYNALRANRPILPKPVQLTVLESSPTPAAGQQAARETLRGKCEVCNVEFESRAAARDHVFSPRHLATLRTTNFGQSATQINNGSAGVVSQASSRSPASSTS